MDLDPPLREEAKCLSSLSAFPGPEDLDLQVAGSTEGVDKGSDAIYCGV